MKQPEDNKTRELPLPARRGRTPIPIMTTEEKADHIRRALFDHAARLTTKDASKGTIIDMTLLSPCDLLAELTSANKEEREHAKAAIRLLVKIGRDL